MNTNIKYPLSGNLKNSKHFFCISYYEGDLSWIYKLDQSKYIVYNKSAKELPKEIKNIKVKNVGYNLYSYLEYIIKNYDNLPDSIIFCKNNIFDRHLNKNLFLKLIKREIFTSLEENISEKYDFVSLTLSDQGFNEINTSWYKYNYDRLYFANYNDFYSFIFKGSVIPIFLKFSPGGNYLLKKENILIRPKSFYQNLKLFISHSQFSCESHFLERSLETIWTSNLEIKNKMKTRLSKKEINFLKTKCALKKAKEIKYVEKFKQKIIILIGKLYYKVLKLILL